MTGHDRRTAVREGVSAPDALLLEKPIDREEMLAAVRRAVERARGRSPEDLPDAGAAR